MTFPPSVRKAILERDPQCRGRKGMKRCPSKSNDAHHIIPKKKGGKDKKENGVGLCKRCHCLADNGFVKYGLTTRDFIWIEEKEK